jgi:predicted transcriptional regulator
LRYRSRTEIIADILRPLCRGDATKTEIMHDAFLSFSQAQDFLSYLVERGLVSFDRKSSRYRLSGRGMELVDLSEGFRTLIELAPFDRVGASF